MNASRAVGFHTRPQGVDWTGAAILVSSVFAAMAVLATV
jgi:hypothetical protein